MAAMHRPVTLFVLSYCNQQEQLISSLNFSSEEPRDTAGTQQSFPKHELFTRLPLQQVTLAVFRIFVLQGMGFFTDYSLTYSSHS